MHKFLISCLFATVINTQAQASNPCLDDICLGDPLQGLNGAWISVDALPKAAATPKLTPFGNQEPVDLSAFVAEENAMMIQYFVSLSNADQVSLREHVSRFFAQDGVLMAKGNLITDQAGLSLIQKKPLRSCDYFAISLVRTSNAGYTDYYTALPADLGNTFGPYEVVFMQREYQSQVATTSLDQVKTEIERQYGPIKTNRFFELEKTVFEGRGFKIKLKDKKGNTNLVDTAYLPQPESVTLQYLRLPVPDKAPASVRYTEMMKKKPECQKVGGGFPAS